MQFCEAFPKKLIWRFSPAWWPWLAWASATGCNASHPRPSYSCTCCCQAGKGAAILINIHLSLSQNICPFLGRRPNRGSGFPRPLRLIDRYETFVMQRLSFLTQFFILSIAILSRVQILKYCENQSQYPISRCAKYWSSLMCQKLASWFQGFQALLYRVCFYWNCPVGKNDPVYRADVGPLGSPFFLLLWMALALQ